MEWKGAARKLAPEDIAKAAASINVEAAALKAVMAVEARGSGFDKSGRLLMLFEPHIFNRELPAIKRDQAIRAGLACKKWGQIKYGPSSAQYDRINKAIDIDRNAALRSASFGLGQVMGFNHQRAGHENAEQMVEAMKESEFNQLMCMVNFIKSSHLDDELQRKDWAGFARGYNGAGYAKNHYDTKLRDAYKKARG